MSYTTVATLLKNYRFTLKFKFKVNCRFGKLHYQVILVYNKQLQVKSIGGQ